MTSLSRIFDLARRTDGPVVLYDMSTDTDYVLMRGDSYENWEYEREDDMLDDWYDIERRFLIEDMDSEDLLDQINRDIAVWRAKEQLEKRDSIAEKLAHELTEHPLTDPFAEDYMHTPEWHTPADILSERGADELTVPHYTPVHEPFVRPQDLRGLRDTDLLTDVPGLRWDDQETVADEQMSPPMGLPEWQREGVPIQIEEVPFDPPMPYTMVEAEPLSDTDMPVFYDEPNLS